MKVNAKVGCQSRKVTGDTLTKEFDMIFSLFIRGEDSLYISPGLLQVQSAVCATACGTVVPQRGSKQYQQNTRQRLVHEVSVWANFSLCL